MLPGSYLAAPDSLSTPGGFPPGAIVPINRGPISQGLISQAPISQGPISRSLIIRGPISQGLINRGHVSQGPVSPESSTSLMAAGPHAPGILIEGAQHPSLEDLLELMRRSRAKGVSDLVLASEDRPYARIAGEWRPAMEGRVRLPDLAALLERLTRNEAATALVLGGVEMDFGCEARASGEAPSRFRGNASAVANGWAPGLSLTLRLLPDLPPPLESLELDPGLSRALLPDNGLVLVTGVMGSGKSTLLASVLRRLLETTRRHVATYESPIEFDLANLPGRLAPVGQSEIGRHLPAFGMASRNAARRAADVVLIGEARDRETLRSALEAAEIGVAVYATVHTRGVAATPGRIISAFARGERPQIASALLSALRVVIQQRLYPKVGGGRLAVREWLVLDREVRDDLQSLPFERVRERLETLVSERGRSLAASARVETERGRLAPEILREILREKGGSSV